MNEHFIEELLNFWMQQVPEDKRPSGVKQLDEAIAKEKIAQAKREKAEFANDCKMWILQLKGFILDTLTNEKKANSQIFLDFLDELNKLSVIL
jgi:hypothetical protein